MLAWQSPDGGRLGGAFTVAAVSVLVSSEHIKHLAFCLAYRFGRGGETRCPAVSQRCAAFHAVVGVDLQVSRLAPGCWAPLPERLAHKAHDFQSFEQQFRHTGKSFRPFMALPWACRLDVPLGTLLLSGPHPGINILGDQGRQGAV